MQVMPLQEMQHAGEFVAAAADLGARRGSKQSDNCQGPALGWEVWESDSAVYWSRFSSRFRISPSRSISSGCDPDCPSRAKNCSGEITARLPTLRMRSLSRSPARSADDPDSTRLTITHPGSASSLRQKTPMG